MTAVDGAFMVGLERNEDDRGFFARTFCEREFAEHGLDSHFPQASTSHSAKRGTLRGMHFEVQPSKESKIVRCSAGAIHDVIIDLRPSSPTYLLWDSVQLSRRNGASLYIPSGCAHGFLTLVDDVDVEYQMGSPFRPHAGRGVRWNDPAFGVAWPFEPVVVSERDATYPDYQPSGSSG